jgi:APA family basic amino acid/polyamine antiporter
MGAELLIKDPAQPGANPAAPALIRSIGPFQLTLYGLGSMLGSGIYGLIGQAAGQVGNAVWASFLVAMGGAADRTVSRIAGLPLSPAGGAAFVTQKAFGVPLLSFVVGLAVVCSGLASVATQSQVFARNLAVLLGFASFPLWAAGAGFLLVMAALVLRGIRESMWMNVAFTLAEATCLLLVIAVGIPYWDRSTCSRFPCCPAGTQWPCS